MKKQPPAGCYQVGVGATGTVEETIPRCREYPVLCRVKWDKPHLVHCGGNPMQTFGIRQSCLEALPARGRGKKLLHFVGL